MADEPKPPTEPGGMFTHMPLPYIVRVRIVSDDDAAPTVREVRTTAYSVFEALMQVTFEAGGSEFNDAKVKVEEVKPDVAAYRTLFMGEIAAALARQGKR